MTPILLTLIFVWLFLVTLLLAAVIRHLATIQLGLGMHGFASERGFNFDTDGPPVPSELPEDVIAALERGAVQTEDTVAAFFSSSCKPCRERAEDIARTGVDRERTVFLITGRHPEGVQNLRDALEPIGAPLLFDPAAHDVAKAVDINSTPFALRIRNRSAPAA